METKREASELHEKPYYESKEDFSLFHSALNKTIELVLCKNDLSRKLTGRIEKFQGNLFLFKELKKDEVIGTYVFNANDIFWIKII